MQACPAYHDQVVLRFFFYKNSTLNFTYVEDQQFFHNIAKN